MIRRLTTLLAMVVFLASGPARADEAEDAAKRQKAGQHVMEGDRFKDAGEYEKAAREYEKAYELVPHPELFFNLGQVYRLGGDDVKALEYYERYLAVQPKGRAAPQARQFVKSLKRAIEKKRAKAEKKPKKDRKRTAEAIGGETGNGGETGGEVDVVKQAPPDRGERLRLAGMATAGAGVVALGVGVAFGLSARGISNDLSGHDQDDGPWTDAELDSQAKGKRHEKWMFVATGVGGACVIGGAVLYYLGSKRRSDDAALTAAPIVGQDSLGFALSGRF
jgi:hypothetical protein